MTSSCFICGCSIRRQLGFNPAALTTTNCKILKSLRKSWSDSLCTLLDVSSGKCRRLLHSVPYCLSCHKVICNVDFMMTTISRLEGKLLEIKKQIKGQLIRSSKKHRSEHRELIQKVLAIDDFVPNSVKKEKYVKGYGIDTENLPSMSVNPLRVQPSAANTPADADPDEGDNEFQMKIDNDDPEWSPSPTENTTKLSKKNKTSVKKSDTSSKHILKKYRKRLESKHSVTRSRQKDYTCPICQEVVTGYAAMREHTKSHPKPPDIPIPRIACQFCGKRFNSDEEAKSHEILHEPFLGHKPFTCVFCNSELRSTYDLQKHVKAEHEPPPTAPTFPCDICPLVLSSHEKLKRHKTRTHLIGVTKMYQCPQCPFQAVFPSILKYHSYNHGERQFKCDVENCSANYFSKKAVRMHKIRVHGMGGIVYPCTLCPRKFHTAMNLRNHQLYHSSLRPFMCEVCSSTFKTNRNLRSHTKVHADDKVTGDNFKLRNPRKARLSNNRLQQKMEGDGSCSGDEEVRTGNTGPAADSYSSEGMFGSF